MKKFKSGDLVYGSIKAYPKVKFFVNSGSISYNNDTDNSGNASLFDFLRNPGSTVSDVECALLTEAEAIIYTETEGYLKVENCVEVFNFLLAEDGQPLLEETGTELAPE
jgi:hypothetical protein